MKKIKSKKANNLNLMHSPIGWVPEKWCIRKLSKVADIKYGISDPLEKNRKKGIPIIGMPNVTKDGDLKWDNRFYVENDRPDDSDLLEEGDILFNWRNGSKKHLGKTAFFNLKGKYTHVGFLLRIRCGSALYPRYCDLYLKAIKIKGYFLAAKMQVNNTFNKEELSSVPIVFPSLIDQVAIASLISIWDKAIEKIEQLILAKEKTYQLMSVRLLFGNCVDKADENITCRWFSIPKHWEIVNIGKIAKEIKLTNNLHQNMPVLSCTKYDGLVDSMKYFGKRVFSENTSSYKVVKRNQFAYATNHIEEGSIGYQNSYDNGLVSPMYTVFETKSAVEDGYLYKVLKTSLYKHIFQVNTSASVDRRGSLRWKEFAKIPIPLPPIGEQKKINEGLDFMRSEIALVKKQAEAYRKQKRGLMQKLLTGEWRVALNESQDLSAVSNG